MSIENAILGLLSWRPLSGYDLKKMFEDSAALYWSGNNNEIYRALVGLHRSECVTFEVQPQEHLPARKIYSITPKGREELRQWVQTAPEPPQRKQIFLIQLAWADSLSTADLDGLLAQYEEDVRLELMLNRARLTSPTEKTAAENRARFLDAAQARSPREALLWSRIQQNWTVFYEHELAWVTGLRAELKGLENPEK
jgi:PadR family transcriptional regulator, regulatory protein AphA